MKMDRKSVMTTKRTTLVEWWVRSQTSESRPLSKRNSGFKTSGSEERGKETEAQKKMCTKQGSLNSETYTPGPDFEVQNQPYASVSTRKVKSGPTQSAKHRKNTLRRNS